MQIDELHSRPIGSFVWVYRSTFNNNIERALGRVVEHPSESLTTLVEVKKDYSGVTISEQSYGAESVKVAFSPCDDFRAEVWLADNGVEAAVRKQVSEKEVDYKVALGIQNQFAAIVGAPQASIVKVEERAADDFGSGF